MFQRFIARQLAQPSGLVGRMFTARWLNKANAKMNQLVLEQLAVVPGDRILEVGFGGGDLIERMLRTGKPEFVSGVDRSHEMVRSASKRFKEYLRNGKVELRRGEIENLPYANETFTKVCTVNTLYFWPEPAKALAECRRVLRPEGRLLICFNSKKDMEAWPIHQHGFRLYELAEVEKLLMAAGFSRAAVTSANDPQQGLFYCVVGV